MPWAPWAAAAMMPDMKPVTKPAALKREVRVGTGAMIAFGNLTDYGD